MYSSIARSILAPLFDFPNGAITMKCLRELEESQWWPREKILELQDQRLRRLMHHAYDNVAYYHNMLDDRALKPDDIKCSADLIKLPILNKTLVRRNLGSLLSSNVSSREITRGYTSGSTGEPLMFYRTKNERPERYFAASQRAYGWSGYKVGAKLVSIGQLHEYPSVFEKIKETAKNFFERNMIEDVQSLSRGALPLFARRLEEFKPEFMRGYPSAIYELARFMEKGGNHRIRLKAIITTAEKAHEYQQDLIGKVFGCQTYSFYSACEAPAIASECSSHSGYHITAENIIVEIVDEQDNAVPVGKEGRILVTNLHSFAMPFIRYDIGDLGVLSDHICSCGRGLPLLLKLNGRVTDNILTEDGRSVPGLAFDQYFLDRKREIVQWQIVQESYKKLIVNFVLDGAYPQRHVDRLKAETRSRFMPLLGNDAAISIEIVDQIPLTKSGKRRYIISKIAN